MRSSARSSGHADSARAKDHGFVCSLCARGWSPPSLLGSGHGPGLTTQGTAATGHLARQSEHGTRPPILVDRQGNEQPSVAVARAPFVNTDIWRVVGAREAEPHAQHFTFELGDGGLRLRNSGCDDGEHRWQDTQ